MKRILLPAMLVLGVALPAAADTISVLRENTLTLTQSDGGVTTILVKEGQRMEQVNASGVWAAGFWQIGERGFCWTARGAAELCIMMPMTNDVGATWDVAGPTGQVVWKVEIVAGRADLRSLSGQPVQGEDH